MNECIAKLNFEVNVLYFIKKRWGETCATVNIHAEFTCICGGGAVSEK